MDKLAKAMATLAQLARDKQWGVDWSVYENFSQLAETHLNNGDLVGAFREYCRDMRPLTEALQRQRNKEEVFQPLWEKG